MENLTIYDPDDPVEVAVKTNLNEAQTVNSFSELCRLCNVPLGHGGKQRRNAEAKISQYIDYSEIKQDGQRKIVCIINEIYDIPHVHTRRSGGKYRNRLLRALYYELTNDDSLDPEGLVITDLDKLAVKLGFANQYLQLLSSYRYKAEDTPIYYRKTLSEINPRIISEFQIVCRSRYKPHILGMLNDALSKGMLESVEEHTRLIFEDRSHRVAEEWEDAIITRLHHEFISDGRALYLMKEAEKRKLYSELIKAINEERESHYNSLRDDFMDYTSYKPVLNYREILYIKFNSEKMEKAAARNEIDLIDANTRSSEKQEISLSFIEALDTEFNRRYEQIVDAEKKQIDALNSSLAFGDVSKLNPLEHIYSDYAGSMTTLSRLMISEQYGNYFAKFLGTLHFQLHHNGYLIFSI